MTCGCTKMRKKRQKGCRESLGAPPRDLTKWPDWEEARKLENGEWRLEPEEEAEVPEIIIVSDAVECTPVDLDGESRHEQAEAKIFRRRREMLDEDEKIRSPKRKIIRVETEETQDYVKEGRSTEQEEEEKRTFVPSARSFSLKPLFRCDRQCSEKTLSYWQLASVVVNEGDEACTTNLCHKCFNKHLQAKGEEPLANVKWRQVVDKKAYRRILWKMMGKEPYLRGMWEHFSCERSKKFRQLADEEKQAGVQVSGSRNRQPENT